MAEEASRAPGVPPDVATEPSAMKRAHLEEVLQLTLDTGMLVAISGGDTLRVYDTMRRVADGLGAERIEPSLSSMTLHLTVHEGGWSRTAMKHATGIGIDFSRLTAVSRLTREVDELPIDEYRRRLEAIQKSSKRYPPYLVIPMLGLACAGFADLFEADAQGVVIAGCAGALGATVRYLLMRFRFKPFVFSLVAAFVSVVVVMALQSWTETLDATLSACPLYLIPGVPLLNGTSDLLNGQYLNGLVRLTMSTVIVLGASIGIAGALLLWQVI